MSLLASVQQPNLSNFYFALAGDPSLNNANWAAFPATSNVDMSQHQLLNSTAIEIDGYFLTAGPNELLLDGVPLVTTANLSSIADWSLYQSLSGGVDMAGYTIKNISGLSFLGGNVFRATGGKALVNGQDVVRLWSQCNALVDVDMAGHNIKNVGFGLGTIQTGGTDNILVNGIDVVSKWTDYIAESNVNMNGKAIQNANEIQCAIISLDGQNITATASDLYVNGLPVGSEWSTLPAVSDVSLAQHSIQDVSSIDFYYGPGASVVLNASGGFLYANGNKLAEGSSVNEWSLSPAVSDVNINNHNINNVNYIQISNTAINNLGINCYGSTKLVGNVDMFGSGSGSSMFSFNRTSSPFTITTKTDNYFSGNSNHLNGNCNIVGATSYASSNYIYGGTTIDGGYVRGCSIGCLPEPIYPYFNTQRIDVLPAGILMTSPTYITMNGLGAGNIAMGGALAFAAGSYMTLEHGFGVGSNGIYVQDTARDDAARMVFEFGGSIGNSIDTPTRAGNMDFYGTRMYMANIYATSRGGRFPRLPYLNIYDISSLNFYSGASIVGNVSGSRNLTFNGNVAFSNAIFNGLTMNGNLNMSGNIISNVGALWSVSSGMTISGGLTIANADIDMSQNSISNCRALLTHGVDAYVVTSQELYVTNMYLDPYAGATSINVFAPVSFKQGLSGGGITTDSIGISQVGRTAIDVSGAFHFVNSSVSGSYITGGPLGTSISGGLAVTGNVSISGSVAGLSLSGNLNMGGNSITNCSNITTGRITDLAFVTSTAGISVTAPIVGFTADIGIDGSVDTSGLVVHHDTQLNTITGTPTLVGVDLNFNGRTGTNVPIPVSGSNIANKAYVDSHNPISFAETGSPVNVYTTAGTPVVIATATIVLNAASRVWINSATTYDNTGAGSSDYIVSTYIVFNGSNYNITNTSIPARFSPTVPSSTNVSVQAVSTIVPAGSYTASVYAYANAANTDLTAAHTDLVLTGGFL